MIIRICCRIAAAAALAVSFTGAANADCSNAWADVTVTCPVPGPYTGYRIITPTTRNMPTIGTPGHYPQYGPPGGGGVDVYLYGNGTGYQDFHWQHPQ